ncbi:energy-coupling factor transporter ATPase [Lactobacillus rodentium]|uniref:Energy-coupling factor transporter ATP-binding protein n=1 Tax=Lactobacillus rodentium TaxID=947835 RepID=A0A2Z6TDL4_9LACO|nr:energy-coupling factor transporter ATPase [Lactobacillus rodentium]MCR1893904.1 energy-coupling factor transporter ATPase [Lactobacillus rodentium]GBG04230.1 energy-coupling factor transporter ATP-binding protein [Lactobacillus rodentium]
MSKEIISVKNVSFTYRDSKKKVLNNISFTVNKGEWVSIVGHNGSGKSTLTKLLNGLLIADDPKNSAIYIDQLLMSENNVWKIRDKIGIVFQNPDNQFVGATVEDDVAFGLENRNVTRSQMLKIVPEVLKEVDMLPYKKTEPQNLSGGQKQRVAIAGILVVNPEIIILDEATSMLDPEGRNEILSIIRQLQKEKDITVLSITHNIEEINKSDRVLVLNRGNLLKIGTPDEIFAEKTLIEEAGLELPFVYQLKEELKRRGLQIPGSIKTEEELVDYLCQ